MNILKYNDAYSPARATQSIKDYSFPCVKRTPAIKCHDVKPWTQVGSQSPVIHFGENKEIISRAKKLNDREIKHYKTPQGIAVLNQEGIDLAVERRISLFFQQTILCYKMSAFTFSAKGADAQIGTSPELVVKTENGGLIHSFKREAAHSSTLPTLIAHAKDGSTPNGFVFLKGGSSYAQHNSTIGMSSYVNGADELIDGKKNQDKLRETSVKIINRVASDGLDPRKATIEFIKAFQEESVRTAKQLGNDDTRKWVLNLYSKKIDEILANVEDPDFFDHLIGLNIDPNDPQETTLREVLFKKRYDIIRLQEVIESRIGKRMAVAINALNRDKTLFVHALMKAFTETKEKKIVEKLFCKTYAYLENLYLNQIPQRDQKAFQTFQTKVSNIYNKHKATIDNLAREMREDFNELRKAELSFRAGLFKDLRTKVRNWTQVRFVNEFYEKNGRKISQSWVSRMEQLTRIDFKANYDTPLNQRRRVMNLTEASECAETFDVDVGVFLPCLIVS